MVRERIKELVDFVTTESPYRDANKGWLTDDVYIQWGSSPVQDSSRGVEFANISVLWKPINQILLILFTVLLLSALFVFVAVSWSHGKFEIPLSTPSSTSQLAIDTSELQIQTNSSLEAKEEIGEQAEGPIATPISSEMASLEIRPVSTPSLDSGLEQQASGTLNMLQPKGS